jgi:hypothetical protein
VTIPQKRKMRVCQRRGVKYFNTKLLGKPKVIYAI